jgi:hypothetical protein
MELRLIREPTAKGATLGSLYLNREWFCWTLEDPLREVAGQPVSAWKVKGDTAIPAGRYRVRLTWSPRFKRVLPLLDAVPGYEGIRIHTGNTAADTEGCILPGIARAPGRVLQSRPAFEALFAHLHAAGSDPIWITIENPPELPHA